MSKPVIFIHTNDQQLLGGLVAAYSMRTRSAQRDRFDIRLLRLEQTPMLWNRQGQHYLRKGKPAQWHNEDLQSFSPLRRMVPQLMGFRGRALVTDPDVFAVGDVHELLSADMQGKSLLCRLVQEGYKGNGNTFYASSVMLLDCDRLQHWRWDEDIEAMFASKLDYGPWIALRNEPAETIGELDESWNSFDKLDGSTRLLHMTERSTQPWKTGLPVDFDLNVQRKGGGLSRLRRWLGAPDKDAPPSHYLPHPDPRQIDFFFDLFKECLEAGEITESYVQKNIEARHVRPDVFELLERKGYRRTHSNQPRADSLMALSGVA